MINVNKNLKKGINSSLQIRCNAVNPTIIMTDLVRRCFDEKEISDVAKRTPLRHIGGKIPY